METNKEYNLTPEEIADLYQQINELEEEVGDLSDEVSDLEKTISDLENELHILDEKIESSILNSKNLREKTIIELFEKVLKNVNYIEIETTLENLLSSYEKN